MWIAATFRDEHHAALDWLTLRADADTRFCGVEVSAARNGDSNTSYGSNLSFEPIEDRKACRIADYRLGTITDPPATGAGSIAVAM